MFSTFPYKAIKYQFSSDLPLITLTGIGFQNITDHSYSWHNLHRHDKHCLIQYCISGQGVLTINNSTYTITSGKAFLLNIPSNSHYYLPQNQRQIQVYSFKSVCFFRRERICKICMHQWIM